jgi:hypothetical protein
VSGGFREALRVSGQNQPLIGRVFPAHAALRRWPAGCNLADRHGSLVFGSGCAHYSLPATEFSRKLTPIMPRPLFSCTWAPNPAIRALVLLDDAASHSSHPKSSESSRASRRSRPSCLPKNRCEADRAYGDQACPADLVMMTWIAMSDKLMTSPAFSCEVVVAAGEQAKVHLIADACAAWRVRAAALAEATSRYEVKTLSLRQSQET